MTKWGRRLNKIINNPFDMILGKLNSLVRQIEALMGIEYSSKKFWTDRYLKYGDSLLAAGRTDMSLKENELMYQKAKEVFLSLCRKEKIDFKDSLVLDIGCGTGYYTSVLKELGVTNYLGIDIADVLLPKLEDKYTNYKFEQLDISSDELSLNYDVIIMIDVAHHIISEDKFSFAMQNIKSHLKPEGVFIVSADLSNNNKSSYYEKSKSLNAFQKEFEGYRFSEPIDFRDKYIFSIKRHELIDD